MSAVEGEVTYQGCSLRVVPLYIQEHYGYKVLNRHKRLEAKRRLRV